MLGREDVSKPPLIWAVLIAAVGLIFSAVGLATPEWTVARGVMIGLWVLTDENGVSYSWTSTGDYSGDFFYSSWFTAVRALMMASMIIGGIGIIANLAIIKKKKYSFGFTNMLMCYYLLAFALVVTSAAVYCCMIPQGLNDRGYITNIKEDIVEYIYLGGYGYSLWLSWLGSGAFLLSAGMSFEGSNQKRVQERLYGKNQ